MFNDHGPSSGVDQVYDDYGPPDRRGRAVDYDRALDPTAPPYNDFASPSDTHDHMYNDYGRPAEVRRQRYSDYGAASDSRGPRYRDESYNEYPPSGSHAQRYDYGGPNDSRDQRYHDYGPPADSRDQGYRNYGPRPGSRHQRYHGYGPSDTMYDDYDPSSYNEGYGNWDSGDWPNESYPRDCSYGPWRSHDPARNQPLPPMDQKALMAQLFTPQDNAVRVRGCECCVEPSEEGLLSSGLRLNNMGVYWCLREAAACRCFLLSLLLLLLLLLLVLHSNGRRTGMIILIVYCAYCRQHAFGIQSAARLPSRDGYNSDVLLLVEVGGGRWGLRPKMTK